MGEMALVRFLLAVSLFSSLSIIPPMLHAHHRRYIILATTTPLKKHTFNCALHFKHNIYYVYCLKSPKIRPKFQNYLSGLNLIGVADSWPKSDMRISLFHVSLESKLMTGKCKTIFRHTLAL